MIQPYVFMFLLCSLWRGVNGARLSSSPTLALPARCDYEASITTSPPQLLAGDELRRREDTIPPYWCGTSSTNYWHCHVHSYACMASIYPNGDAYQYCSNVDVGTQIVFTTAVGDWESGKPCPTSAGTLCCTDLAVVTELFIANDYTVTGLGCDTVATTGTFVPYKQLLDPPSFSASLAKATLSSSSSVPISSSSSMPFSSSSSTQDGGGSTGTASPSNPGSGLSSGTKIGIGVGVGVGVGCLLIGAVVFLLWRRYSKKNDRKLAEVSASQAPYSSPPMKSSGPPYSPPMSYNQSQHYHEGQGGPGWAPQPEYSPGGYQESGYGPREMGAQ